ncbi:MAG TPA: hypothetical protein PLL08_03595, partial [Bacteroidales bacterium]|nr:hypothetical protein [Bacteroidales bacterium]
TPEFNHFVFGVNFGFYHSIRLSSRIVDKYEMGKRNYSIKPLTIIKVAPFLEKPVLWVLAESTLLKVILEPTFM